MSEDLIYQSFEIAAERGGDISALVYEKYFQNSPDSAELMLHVDETVKGKMMDELYRLVMVEDYSEESSYLSWEVDNHEMAYSVKPQMYDGLFVALVDTVRQCLGDDWNEAYQVAWNSRIEQLQSEILSRFSQAS